MQQSRCGIDGQDEGVGKQRVELVLVGGGPGRKDIATGIEQLAQSRGVPHPVGFQIGVSLFGNGLASGRVSVV